MCDFIFKPQHAVVVVDLNVIGLLIGFLGGILYYFLWFAINWGSEPRNVR
jgi:hypothetical protein